MIRLAIGIAVLILIILAIFFCCLYFDYKEKYLRECQDSENYRRKRNEIENKYNTLLQDIDYIRAKQELKTQLKLAIMNNCLFIPLNSNNNLMEVWNKDQQYLWDITGNLTIKRCSKTSAKGIKEMETIVTDNFWTAINHPLLQNRNGIYDLIHLVKEIQDDLMIKEET